MSLAPVVLRLSVLIVLTFLLLTMLTAQQYPRDGVSLEDQRRQDAQITVNTSVLSSTVTRVEALEKRSAIDHDILVSLQTTTEYNNKLLMGILTAMSLLLAKAIYDLSQHRSVKLQPEELHYDSES